MLIVIGAATAARAVAAATRADRGCLAYSFAADVEDPDRIHSTEIWADRAALDEHMTHDHTARFLEAAPSLVAAEPTMSFYEVPDR